MSGYLYLDASALTKLILDEPETHAVRQRVRGGDLVSADIAEIEVHRAAARRASPDTAARVVQVLGEVFLYADDAGIRRSAINVQPPSIRSLDAIHVATALRLQPELDAFICYDERLCDAARAVGLPVESPRD